ncbi:hypothetical protein KFU94_23825 [Chloroflexi bacterium TSY]|nr:hypothetical protein [Chloroflexi bacterium TSY]
MANLAQIAYTAADDLGHYPFELGENPLGPFPKGEALGFTLGEWLAAKGSGTYMLFHSILDLFLNLQVHLPNRGRSAWGFLLLGHPTIIPKLRMTSTQTGPYTVGKPENTIS